MKVIMYQIHVFKQNLNYFKQHFGETLNLIENQTDNIKT